MKHISYTILVYNRYGLAEHRYQYLTKKNALWALNVIGRQKMRAKLYDRHERVIATAN